MKHYGFGKKFYPSAKFSYYTVNYIVQCITVSWYKRGDILIHPKFVLLHLYKAYTDVLEVKTATYTYCVSPVNSCGYINFR